MYHIWRRKSSHPEACARRFYICLTSQGNQLDYGMTTESELELLRKILAQARKATAAWRTPEEAPEMRKLQRMVDNMKGIN